MKPLSVMVKVEPPQHQQQPSPSTPSTNSSSNNTNNNSIVSSGGAGGGGASSSLASMMMNPSHSIYPSCLPISAKGGTSSSFVPSSHHQQQSHAFSLPSIHNLTSQQPTSKVMVDHHYQPPPPQQQSWPRSEPKAPLISNNGGHDLMEALSTQSQTVVRYAPPIYQAIIQPSIDIVPMDSFIPGYISGYRNTQQQVTIGSTPEMQPSNPSSSSSGGLIVTTSNTSTPVKISHHVTDHELVNVAKLTQSVASSIVSSAQQQASPSCNNNNTTQGAGSSSADSNQARMACINCRKSHRKCDKGMPCGECKKRGIPDECVYYEPKKRGPKMKTAEEEAQSKEEAKKRKVTKKNNTEIPTATTVVDYERPNLLQSSSQLTTPSSSNLATATITPTLFSRKEVDRRNYILHMIFPEANLPNDIKENCPDDSFNEIFRLFLSDEFIGFLVECMDGNKSKNLLVPFIREKVLLCILNRIMEPYYHGMYFSLESLFLKYYCLYKLSPHDDNRPILLLESEKSVKQSKKDFNMATNDIQTAICNLWSSFFNTILEFKSVNSSYNQLIIKNMLDFIVNKIPENSDIQGLLELQHALFTRYLLLIEIHQQIEGCTTNSVQFKKLVFNFLKLTYLSGATTKSTKLVDQFEKFNTKFFAILTSQYSSMALNTNYVVAEMECFIPRNLTECLTFLSVITSEGEQDLEVLFLEYMSKLLNLSIYMQGILNTNDKNLQEMNASIGKDFFNIASNLRSPIILSILNSLQNYLITSFFANTISIPESPQLENQFKERILTSANQFEHQEHFYLRASHSLIKGKDLVELWKESKKVFIK